MFHPCDYEQTIELSEGINIRFRDVGHMLGSASIEIWITQTYLRDSVCSAGMFFCYNAKPYERVWHLSLIHISIDKCTVEADVIIDFTSAKAVDGLIAYSAEKKVPVVLCTTCLLYTSCYRDLQSFFDPFAGGKIKQCA